MVNAFHAISPGRAFGKVMPMRRSAIAALAVFVAAAAWAQGPEDPLGLLDRPSAFSAPGAEYFSAQAVPSLTQAPPGETFYLGVKIRISPGWFYYSPRPGVSELFTPIPARLSVRAEGLEVGEPLWPATERHEVDLGEATIVNNVYQGEVVLYVPLTVPPDARDGPRTIALLAAGQICSDEEFKCLNVRAEAQAGVTVGPTAAANPAWDQTLDEGLRRALAESSRPVRPAGEPLPTAPGPAEQLTVWAGLGLAVLAGLILNVMPCVLPVIPIRILSIVDLARQQRRRFVTMGLAFAGGIVLFFAALALVNVILRVWTAETLNWGKHFQSAAFRIGMAVLMVALAANLFGAFILSTPCSFAILILALAWAQVQPLYLGTLAIVLIGVGMAAPHALLTAFPSLLNKLPRPGRWMELLKQGIGFAVLLVAVWLIGTLSTDSYPAWVSGFAVVTAFCCWMWGTWVSYDASRRRKVLIRGAALVILVLAGVGMLRPQSPLAVEMEDFSEAALASARQRGQIVLVDFTAAWCLSCKIIERRIYDNAEVAAELKRRGVLALRGDVTRAEMPANRLLYEQLGGAPPLTVIFPASGGPPIRLEGKFSKADLYRALDAAASSGD